MFKVGLARYGRTNVGVDLMEVTGTGSDNNHDVWQPLVDQAMDSHASH